MRAAKHFLIVCFAAANIHCIFFNYRLLNSRLSLLLMPVDRRVNNTQRSIPVQQELSALARVKLHLLLNSLLLMDRLSLHRDVLDRRRLSGLGLPAKLHQLF